MVLSFDDCILLQPVSYAQLARSIHELAATSDQVCIQYIFPRFVLVLVLTSFLMTCISLIIYVEKFPKAVGESCISKACCI